MCGIAGYVGNDPKFDAKSFLEYVHKSLAYRGYDSYGYIGFNENGFHKRKEVGNKLTFFCDFTNIKQVMYHNRWATHGGAAERNCHPIFSSSGKVAVVHNGIVDNYLQWKNTLTSHGLKFVTETDTEVIANAIQSWGFFPSAIYENIASIRGDMAFVASLESWVGDGVPYGGKTAKYKFVAFARKTPLYLSSDGYISSDRATIANFSSSFLELPDDVLGMWDNKWEFYDKAGKVQLNFWYNFGPPIPSIIYDPYEGSMKKEILEQADVPAKISKCDFWRSGPNSSYLLYGCGSSYYAGMLGKLYLRNIGNAGRVNVEYASEVNRKILDSYTTSLAITQSGETKDTIRAAEEIYDGGDLSFALTNTASSQIENTVHKTISIGVGPEYAVASTKTFLGFCLWFYKQGLLLRGESDRDTDIILIDIAKQIREIIENYERFEVFGQYNSCSFVVLGTGYCYPIALEGALKIKEVANCWADAMPAAEIKHGPISMIDKNVVAIVLMSDDRRESIESNIEQIKARGGKVVVIDQKEKFEVTKDLITFPPTKSEICPFLYVICLQLIAYYLAISKGLNPDQPRNLSKAITV